jgi:hypothetical protein
VEAVCKEFNYDAKNIFQSGGPITLLLGQDTQSLILEKFPNLRKSFNPAFRDVSIQGIAASSMSSIVGALGAASSLTGKGAIFKAQVTDGAFPFDSDPCPETLEIAATWDNCTLRVRKQLKITLPARMTRRTRSQGLASPSSSSSSAPASSSPSSSNSDSAGTSNLQNLHRFFRQRQFSQMTRSPCFGFSLFWLTLLFKLSSVSSSSENFFLGDCAPSLLKLEYPPLVNSTSLAPLVLIF